MNFQGEWVDISGNVIHVRAADWKIPNYETKLYGGQQFERMLSEFRAVASHINLENMNMDDIATAAGLSGINSSSNQIWAASDLAQKKCQEVYRPLLEHLLHKAVFVSKRLFDIVANIMESKKKRSQGIQQQPESVSIAKDFPQFVWYVRDLYEDVVDHTAKTCMEKCLDELTCTQLIYWEESSKS